MHNHQREIWLLCDEQHSPLPEPMYFPSHKEAVKWLSRNGYRSNTFLYDMKRNGEAVISQPCMHNSGIKHAQDVSHANGCCVGYNPTCIEQRVQNSVYLGNVRNKSCDVEAYYNSVYQWTESSTRDCERNRGYCHKTVAELCRTGKVGTRGKWKGWSFKYV